MQQSLNMRKVVIVFFIVAVMLSACAPSQAAIQTAIAQTQSAYTPTSSIANISFATPVLATLTPPPSDTPTASPIPKAGSMDSPVPFNAKGTLTDPLSGGTFDLQVQRVVRGPEALYLIQQASTLNLNPPQGMEYILIEVTATLNSGNLNLTDYDFILDSSGKSFGFIFIACLLYDQCRLPDVPCGFIHARRLDRWLDRPHGLYQ